MIKLGELESVLVANVGPVIDHLIAHVVNIHLVIKIKHAEIVPSIFFWRCRDSEVKSLTGGIIYRATAA